jgi:hypothetical protein
LCCSTQNGVTSSALALAGTVSPVKLGVSNTLIGIVCHTDERHAS